MGGALFVLTQQIHMGIYFVENHAMHVLLLTSGRVGKIVRKHLETSNIDSLLYSIYRDDGLDVLPQGLEVQDDYQQHLDSLHPNLKWDLTCASEGGYLDLFLMLKNGKQPWRKKWNL